MNIYKKFFFKFLILSFLFCSIIIGFLFVSDPLGYNYKYTLPVIKKHKFEAVKYDRKLKPLRLIDYKPQTIILGNSRVVYGVNPEDAICFPKPVYNLGMEYCVPYEMYSLLKYAVEVSPIEEVVLFLDYGFFSNSGGAKGFNPNDWQSDKKSKLNRFLFSYFSESSIKGALSNFLNKGISVLSKSSKGSTFNGFVVYETRDDFSGHSKEERVNLVKDDAVNEIDFHPGLVYIKKIIDLCQSQNIKYTFIIAPYPPEHMELRVETRSYTNSVVEWKKELEKISTVYDFYNIDNTFASNDFYDQVHFKPIIGKYIFKKICDDNSIVHNNEAL